MIWPSNSILGILKKNEDTYLHKNLYMNFLSNIIHNHQRQK